MARTKNYDKEIEDLEIQIGKTSEKLMQLKSHKAELIRLKKEKELENLYDLISNNGLSVEELKNIITEKSNPEMETVNV